MQHLDAIACWRNRQAELEFHICRHEWFLDKTAVLNQDALQHKINAYRTEWNSYERLIKKVQSVRPVKSRSAAA